MGKRIDWEQKCIDYCQENNIGLTVERNPHWRSTSWETEELDWQGTYTVKTAFLSAKSVYRGEAFRQMYVELLNMYDATPTVEILVNDRSQEV
jgi:hypothetical protein